MLPFINPRIVDIGQGMSGPFFLCRIQEPVRVAVAELDEAAMGKDGRLVYPLAVDICMGVRMTWRQRRHPFGVGDDAVTGLNVGAVEL